MKKILITILITVFFALNVFAFEDCIISTDGRLSDISIEYNDIIDVYPIFTIMNEKNTIFLHPLKEGKTRICVLKNNKEKVLFNVEVTQESTIVEEIDGFEVLSIDSPPYAESSSLDYEYNFELDIPPENLGEDDNG